MFIRITIFKRDKKKTYKENRKGDVSLLVIVIIYHDCILYLWLLNFVVHGLMRRIKDEVKDKEVFI